MPYRTNPYVGAACGRPKSTGTNRIKAGGHRPPLQIVSIRRIVIKYAVGHSYIRCDLRFWPCYPGSVLSPSGIGKGRTLALQDEPLCRGGLWPPEINRHKSNKSGRPQAAPTNRVNPPNCDKICGRTFLHTLWPSVLALLSRVCFIPEGDRQG